MFDAAFASSQRPGLGTLLTLSQGESQTEKFMFKLQNILSAVMIALFSHKIIHDISTGQ
jgi:hypothetical protein